jgi:hypothetical protein
MARSKEVDRWFAGYDNPMKDVVMRIREIVRAWCAWREQETGRKAKASTRKPR